MVIFDPFFINGVETFIKSSFVFCKWFNDVSTFIFSGYALKSISDNGDVTLNIVAYLFINDTLFSYIVLPLIFPFTSRATVGDFPIPTSL